MRNDSILSFLRLIPSFLGQVECRGTEVFVFIHKSFFLPIVLFLTKHTFSRVMQFVDLCVVDTPSEKERFTLLYTFLSFTWNFRIHLVFSVNEVESVPSLCSVFPNANWAEREAYDLFGVFFKSHPDLRRILTDYGFEGFPLRKDFPLTGYVEVRFDDEQKRILYEPLELAQEFRTFDLGSPWLAK